MSLKIPQFQARSVDQQESTLPASSILTGAGTGAACGYFAFSGGQMSAKELMEKYGGENADKFIQSIKGFETLPAEEQAKFNHLKTLLTYKDTSVQELEEATKLLFRRHKETTLRKFISKVAVKKIYPKLGLKGKASSTLLASGVVGSGMSNYFLAKGGSFVNSTIGHWWITRWGIRASGVLLPVILFFRHKNPEGLAGRFRDYNNTLSIIEREAANKVSKCQRKGSEKLLSKANIQLLKIKTLNAVYTAMHFNFVNIGSKNKITQETAQNILKNAQEAADKTILNEIEETLQQVGKHFPKNSLKNAGIGAVIGALLLGALAIGHKQVQKNNQDK